MDTGAGQRMLSVSWSWGRAVMPSPAASMGMPSSELVLSIIAAAFSEASPELELVRRGRAEVGW